MRIWKRIISLLLCMTMVFSCIPNVWAADAVEAAQTSYVKVTSEAEFTTGNYVLMVSSGYAAGALSGGWITAAQPVVSGDEVTDTAGAVWHLTVVGSTVKLTDGAGVSIAPKSGNNNGIQSGDYSWNWSFADGAFRFMGVGTDTTTLASNTTSGQAYTNQLRAYKNATVASNTKTYLADFTLYKEVELGGTDTPVATEPAVTEPVIRENVITVTADKTVLHPGDEFTVTVSISGDVPFTSVGYVPEQESVYFEILSGTVLSGGQSATMADYKVGSGGVIYFENATTVNDAIFSVTMRVREDAPVGAFEATAKFEGVQLRNVDEYVPFGFNEPTFTVRAVEPDDGTLLTVAEAIAMASAMEHNVYTTNKMKVTGVITEVYNTTYGNMRITDGAGNILTIYGTYSADGKLRYDKLEVQPVAGDTVTVYGVLGQYNGVPQIKNGWLMEHIVSEPEPTEPVVTEPVVTEPSVEPTEPPVEPSEPSGSESFCPHCDQNVQWEEWTGTKPSGGHYRMVKDMDQAGICTIGQADAVLEVVLDLNGYTLTSQRRAFTVNNGGKLVLLDTSAEASGMIQCNMTSGSGGVAYITVGSVDILSGTYCMGETAAASTGGLFMIPTLTGSLNIRGGKFVGGHVTGNGGIMAVNKGKVTITGGSFVAGKADGNGDGIYIGDSASVYISGDPYISGVFLGNNAILTLEGAPMIRSGESAYGLKVISNSLVQVGALERGASISVTANGIFTTAFASVDEAALASMYFTCDDASKVIMVQNNALAVADSSVYPTEPVVTEPVVTEPVVTEPVTPSEPADGTWLSIQEAIALGSSMAHDTYTTNKIKVTGVITEVYNTTYGNMRLTDEKGNILTVYGTYSADGKLRYDAMEVKPVAGDTVTVYGVLGQYNKTPQIKNGWIVEHTVAEPQPTEPTEPGVSGAILNLGFQTNRISYATDKVVYQAEGITFTNEKAGSTTIMRDAAADDHIRLYAKSLVRVECPGMTKLVFTCSSGTYASAAQGSMAGLGKVTVNGTLVTLELEKPCDSIEYTATAQHRYTQVEVFAEGGSVEPTEPVVTEPSVEPTVPPIEPSEPSGRTAYCPHCGNVVEWTAWDGYKPTENIHLYLAEDMDVVATTIIGVSGMNSDVVVDLNGHVINSKSRTFTVSYEANLSLLDSVGGGAIYSYAGGTGGMFQTSKGNIHIYSGYYEFKGNEVKNGGLFSITGATSSVNIYGGTFVGGEITGNGGIMYAAGGCTVNILGGTFIPGKAVSQGHGLFITGEATQAHIGGNAYFEGGVQMFNAKLTLSGSPVIVAKSSEYGLKVSATPITVGQLERGAQISVTANGIFTDPFESVDDAAAAMMYFTCDDPSKMIITQNSALAVADAIVEPTEPSVEPTEPPVEPTQPSLPPEDADVTVYVIPEQSEVQQGGILSILVKAESRQPLSSLGYIHLTDGSVFSFLSGEVLAAGAMLSDYAADGGVVAFSSATSLNGDVFRLTVRINDDAPLGYAVFTDSVAANNSAQQLSVALVETGVNVVCKEHDFTDWMVSDFNEHYRYCPKCGKTEYLPHDWDGGMMIKAPSCYEYGEMVYSCVTCGYSRTEQIEPTYNHVYGEWIDQYDGTHRRNCLQEGCWSYEHYGHSWDGGVETIAPTCIHSGIRTYTCLDCGALWEDTIWPTYIHTYGDWSYMDEYGHTRLCTVEGCGAQEYWNHSWDGGNVTKQPTCVEMGFIQYTCLDCGGIRTDTLWPTYTHIYTDKVAVDQYLHSWGCETCSEVWYGDHYLEQGTCHGCGYIRTYTVTFRDADGTVISENTYHYGDTVAIPADPSKPTDGKYIYAFAGWNRELLTECVGSATYTAQYEIVAVRADFDGDGVVTDDDAYYLLRHVLFGDLYPATQEADLNGDGVTSDADAMYLLRYVLFGPERYPLA